MTDLCPHRSAPLSMGEMDGGKLRCFYHGWAFGKDGACVSIPTANGDAAAPGKSFCAKHHAVVERDGLLFVWRGNPLTADPLKLPTRAAAADDADTVTITTTLDYGVDWQPVMASSLGAADLFSFAARARAADAPNVLRGAGAGGAPPRSGTSSDRARRTRVILQQTLAKGGAASARSAGPRGEPLSFLVRNRNYQMPSTRTRRSRRRRRSRRPRRVGPPADRAVRGTRRGRPPQRARARASSPASAASPRRAARRRSSSSSAACSACNAPTRPAAPSG